MSKWGDHFLGKRCLLSAHDKYDGMPYWNALALVRYYRVLAFSVTRFDNIHFIFTQDPKDPTKCLYMGPCVSNPCQNGATCQNVGVDFKCKCNEGFRGKLCHVLILPAAAVLSSEALIAILICILILLGI